MIRSPLLFAEDVLPAPHPIRQWSHFCDFVDSHQAAGKAPAPRPTGHNPSVVAAARVDEGRWIADCPWGCGAAYNVPKDVTTMWCTECAGGGWGKTAELAWPAALAVLTLNLESLPAMLQSWPCAQCRDAVTLCTLCSGMAEQEVFLGHSS